MKAFLTGATSGIGEALVPLLASKGYTLILSGRNQEKLKALGWAYILADLATDRKKIIEVLEKELPDLLINCAGFGKYGEMAFQAIEQQMRVLEVNAIAPIELSLAYARALIRSGKKGVVLNVSSVAGDFPAPGMGLYGPAKACLTHFSRTLDTEVAPKGVRVLVSCPGMVATPFSSRAGEKKKRVRGMAPAYAAEQILKQIERKQEKRTFNWFYRLAHLLPSSLIKSAIWRAIKKRI